MPTVFYLYFPTFHSLIEQQHHKLQGQPVAVVKQQHILDMSPEAAKMGVSKGESVRRAKLTCPNLVTIAAARDYSIYSRLVWDICANFTPIIELADDVTAFLDITGCKTPVEAAKALIKQIYNATKLPAFISIGSSKFVAKVAALLPSDTQLLARYKKAQHIIWVPSDETTDFLRLIPIKYLWIQPSAVVERLIDLGCRTFDDLAQIPLLQLQIKFGQEAKRLLDLAIGIDQDPVRPNYPERCLIDTYTCPPEVGCIKQATEIETILGNCAKTLFRKLLESNETCTKITLHIKFTDGNSTKVTKQLSEPIEQWSRLTREIIRLWRQVSPRPIIEVKIQIHGLQRRTPKQIYLYQDLRKQQTQNLEKALSYLAEKLGPSAVKPASDIEIPRREKMLNLIEQNIL